MSDINLHIIDKRLQTINVKTPLTSTVSMYKAEYNDQLKSSYESRNMLWSVVDRVYQQSNKFKAWTANNYCVLIYPPEVIQTRHPDWFINNTRFPIRKSDNNHDVIFTPVGIARNIKAKRSTWETPQLTHDQICRYNTTRGKNKIHTTSPLIFRQSAKCNTHD